MTNLTATWRSGTPRPGSVRRRLFALLATACTLSFALLPGLASARARHAAPRRHVSHQSHRTHRARQHKVHKTTHPRRHHRSAERGAHAAVRMRVAAAHAPTCAHAHVRISHASGRGEVRQAVNCLINVQRRNHGLPGLRGNNRLNDSAQGWTNVMVHDRAFSHGADFAGRISAVGFDWSRAGENIATGYGTAAGVVRAWMASTGHCQNILNPQFREEGMGVDLGDALPHGRGTWTMDFALRMHQRATSNDWAAAEGCPYRGA
jgi:uncharacterized protein YkwD